MPRKTAGIYVLRLEDGNYWVGKSNWAAWRVGDCFIGNGPNWTQRHDPVEVVEIIPEHNDNPITCREKVVEMMEEHGWENVRGYPWVHPNLKNAPDDLQE